jgi:hypothetical protein
MGDFRKKKMAKNSKIENLRTKYTLFSTDEA